MDIKKLDSNFFIKSSYSEEEGMSKSIQSESD